MSCHWVLTNITPDCARFSIVVYLKSGELAAFITYTVSWTVLALTVGMYLIVVYLHLGPTRLWEVTSIISDCGHVLVCCVSVDWGVIRAKWLALTGGHC